MISVKADNIVKTYNKGTVTAVNDVSFEVEQGTLFGIIGPDGAGKTSIFRILTTLLLADKGTASVDGYDVVKQYRNIRNRVGYMPGKFSLYQDLTILENLHFFATVFGTSLEENYELIKDIYIQIEPFKNRRAGKLSGGMKQKLALCCALIHKPSVLFLDEPTTGVDAVSRKEFWEMLQRLRNQGITILVSTPYMDEATLCDRIALMQNGKLLSVNSPERIISDFSRKLFAVEGKSMYELLNVLKEWDNTHSAFAFGDQVHLTLSNDSKSDELISFLNKKNQTGVSIKQITPGIEDCFIQLMN